jgi:acrylyl-CoA reductase (NADPH)
LANHASAWWIADDGSGGRTTHFRNDIAAQELGAGIRVRVEFSALNYKDALALTGSPGVVRTTPLVPGIDAAGVVEDSSDPRFPEGTRVVVTGFGYGEDRHGGLATTMVVAPEHLMAIPEAMTTHQAAAFGTAGFTALVAVHALRGHGLTPQGQKLPIAVTGAAGAVGSFATFFLASEGFAVHAITGRTDEAPYLEALGASEVISRQEVLGWPNRPLLPEKFDGAVDQAGGELLAKVLASTAANGVVAASGLAGGMALPTTVAPFILRGVTLVGVNSVYQDMSVREALWSECAKHSSSLTWDEMSQTIPLSDAKETAERVLQGLTRGRVVVEMPA